MDFKLPIFKHAPRTYGYRHKDSGERTGTISIIGIGLVVALLILGMRLFHITVVRGDYYRLMSDRNRTREVIIEAVRGTISDRNGTKLAYSTNVNIASTSARIASRRVYPDGHLLGHVIGYRQRANEQEFGDDPCVNKLILGDKIGKKNVEQVYDCRLRGVNGYKLVEVSARGSSSKSLAVVDPVWGQDIVLALDMRLQRAGYDALVASQSALPGIKKAQNPHASVIVTDPRNGEILSYLSLPSYDPQDFEDESPRVAQYIQDSNKPLFNRVSEASYPPGSVFKPIVAAGALEEGKIKSNTLIMDNGYIKAGAHIFHNWYYTEYGKTEGEVDLVKALKRSNDIYFYKTGERMGELGIKRWAQRFGLGERVAFPFDQTVGNVPSPFWKKEHWGENWYLGDTYNYSIGQGYLLASPLQMHQALAAFATKNGTICDPQLELGATPNCRKMPISIKTLELVRRGMHEACRTNGTGWPLVGVTIKGRSLDVGCKTGTAESQDPKNTLPHAWFTAFAPYDNPTIHITVMLENAGQGSDQAAPIARAILEAYFATDEKRNLLPTPAPTTPTATPQN